MPVISDIVDQANDIALQWVDVFRNNGRPIASAPVYLEQQRTQQLMWLGFGALVLFALTRNK